MALLSEEQITEGLAGLEGWEWDREAGALRRSVEMPDFISGIHLVTAVARAAEEVDHHPDIDIRYTTVTFHQTTHAAGGITRADLDMAARIDALAAEALPRS
ncbi:4a-hydroxytetrahydrobiopterin dehydratase [Streptomonospora sp. S1-112]|uniref:Putative pterin-4-alpha-carbinolamine dehydratase n=1 Tax=Streptomonospora mangrovi TaxID=2883123 RepID=A0A9X3SD56_9ACTN|nr:4a-hydroxytetrahydrobiopterin dehydratase [Streptomonospora mangrovi]MDA0563487.1 4a-hydroxytetrahydrobiopterin dehydratase [Streptomonospora mangrovi]